MRGGGYCFSTDWGIANVVMQVFPGFVKTRGPAAPLSEMEIDIAPAPGQRSHPLLEGVFLRGTHARPRSIK